jgi:hypothetical protein
MPAALAVARRRPPEVFRGPVQPHRLWSTRYVTVTYRSRMALPRNGFGSSCV